MIALLIDTIAWFALVSVVLSACIAVGFLVDRHIGPISAAFAFALCIVLSAVLIAGLFGSGGMGAADG